MSDAAEAVVELVREHNGQDQTFARMFRKIMREIRPCVSDFEFVVLMYIFDRTYSYGKQVEVIPIHHFLEGVRTGDGVLLHPRVHASRRSVYRALQNLIDNVIIITSKKHRTATPSYMINPMWSPDLCHQRHKLVPPLAQTSATGGTHNKKNITCDTQQVAPAYAGRNGLEEEVQTPKERLAANLAAATEKRNASRATNKAKLNATGLEKIWEDAFRAAYPDDTYFKWRMFEQSAFANAVKRGVPREQLEPFITFAATHFDNVINTRFRWMKSKLAVNVGFVTKHIAEFFAAFEEDRDPNRKTRRAIREAGPRQAPQPKQDNNDELEALRAENAALKAKEGARAVQRQSSIKKLIRRRPSSSPEFGSWED